MNVELTGVRADGPESTVGEASRIVCSRRLTEDLFFRKILGLCVRSSPGDSSRLCRCSVVVVVAVIGLELSDKTESMSKEGGDLNINSCC